MHLFKFWTCRTQFSVVAGRQLVKTHQGRATTPKGMLQILGISGRLFWEGTALIHNSFQRVRGHSNFLEGWGWEQTRSSPLPHTSSYLSPFSCNTRQLPPSWDPQYTGTKQPSAYPSRNLNLPPLELLGRGKNRKLFLQKVREKDERRTSSPTTQRAGENGTCPGWSVPPFPPWWSLSLAPVPQLPKTTGRGRRRYQKAAWDRGEAGSPHGTSAPRRFHPNLALPAHASCCCWARLGLVTTASCECVSYAYWRFLEIKQLFMVPNTVFTLIKLKYKHKKIPKDFIQCKIYTHIDTRIRSPPSFLFSRLNDPNPPHMTDDWVPSSLERPFARLAPACPRLSRSGDPRPGHTTPEVL